MVLQKRTHRHPGKIYEGKIQTYSHLLNLLRNAIHAEPFEHLEFGKISASNSIRIALKSSYRRGPLPVQAAKVVAHKDDDDDGHGDHDADENALSQKSTNVSRRINRSNRMDNRSAGLVKISKLFENK